MNTLDKTLDAALDIHGQDFYRKLVPHSIVSNLKPSFEIRPYQQNAFGRFIFYWEQYASRPKGRPVQLLYHMATGSGKTLIMAGLMLYLYEKGYRHFLFFVNSTNIIEKTKDNFLNMLSSKYLFAENISFSGNQVAIREVENFQNSVPDDINISFNTVQGLHSKLNAPRENSLTYDDFENNKIVLISDEAHHINAETKKGKELSTDDRENIVSWEATITRIFNANPENLMLEFTATADLSNPDIAKKYENKLLFDYPLRQFRADGYSKDVQTLQADLPPFERALQAMLLSQYRRKLFEKNGLIIKPVILFKSKTIKESNAFRTEFNEKLKALSAATLAYIGQSNADTVVGRVFDYCVLNNISLDNLIEEIKVDFGEDKQISVNSREESETKQIDINSLEDEDNEYRLIFAVDKLNEGWDVLNLFDIVRLYDTRDAKKNIPGKTTMQEAQLIGRGARYCPFRLGVNQPLYMRKFDDDDANEMRICEELYYHASYNPHYIRELNTALVEIGIKPVNAVQRKSNSKDDCTETEFCMGRPISENEQKEYGREDIYPSKNSISEQMYRVKLQTGMVKQRRTFDNEVDTEAEAETETKDKEYKLIDFGERIIRKALNKLDFYRFNNLQSYFPDLDSITEFVNSENYLAKIRINVNGVKSDVDNLTPRQKLDIAVQTLHSVSSTMKLSVNQSDTQQAPDIGRQ